MTSLFTDEEAAEELIRGETAEPLDWEREAVERALRVARARLTLPEHVKILWRVHPGPDSAVGVCEGSTIYLGVGPHIGPELLGKTALHELAHAHDRHAGRPWDRGDWEQRADYFATSMLPYWRSGKLPAPSTRPAAPTSNQAIGPAARPTDPKARTTALLNEVRRRFGRLRSRLDGEDRRALGALHRCVEELALKKR